MAVMKQDPSQILMSVVAKLSLASNLEETTQIVAAAARSLTGADGTSFVLRDKGQCYYADEDAISPLWKGKRFPMEACISGWSMLNREIVTIEDIYKDSRIPQDAYRPTFVKSLCMVPIRVKNPIGAIGNYWAKSYAPSENEIKTLQILADSTSVALENLALKQAVHLHSSELTDWRDRANHLEVELYSMAHDLRSPLSVMTGLAEILKSKARGTVDVALMEHIHSIVETGRRTAGQIDRMLSLYRASNGKMDKQEVDISKFANRILDGYRSVLPDRNIEFVVDYGMSAYADASLIYLVLENLLSNAVKFSSKKEQTHIHVGSLNEKSGFQTFFVQDNGFGFDPSQAENLFKPLSRLQAHSEFSGTGLGLSSVSRIIDLHRGYVRAEGKEKSGAKFYFGLPFTESVSN